MSEKDLEVDAGNTAPLANISPAGLGTDLPNWLIGLDHRDWLFDGHPINTASAIERFKRLNWHDAYMDLGPSPMGNLGPYWHVPLADEETVHRLYPKLLSTKWLPLIRQAIDEAISQSRERDAPTSVMPPESPKP